MSASTQAHIVTWNLNSIRSRLTHLLEFLRETSPDIVLLQELKVETDAFPYTEIEDAGYNCAVWGQKTYNGVAILSKTPLEDTNRGLPGDDSDEQARYIEAVTTIDHRVLRVASIYVPNGQAMDSDKFAYKLQFYDRLIQHARTLMSYEEILVLGADYNVAYLPQDVYDSSIDGTVCYNSFEREKMHILLNLGLYDAFRMLHPQDLAFSWWDYRAGKFHNNEGLRIDHLLLSPEAVNRLQHSEIITAERAKDKPSDHAPVLCSLALQ